MGEGRRRRGGGLNQNVVLILLAPVRCLILLLAKSICGKLADIVALAPRTALVARLSSIAQTPQKTLKERPETHKVWMPIAPFSAAYLSRRPHGVGWQIPHKFPVPSHPIPVHPNSMIQDVRSNADPQKMLLEPAMCQ